MLSIFNYKLSEAKFGVIILELLFWDLLLTNTPATPAWYINYTIFQFAHNEKKKGKGKKKKPLGHH